MYAGVDEAGRGPVIGPLVVAGVAGPTETVPDGVGDSKQLPPDRRKRLEARIREAKALNVAVVEIPAAHLNDRMQQGQTLDAIETDAFACVLSELAPSRAVVDTVGSDPDAFAQTLARAVEGEIDVEARSRADETDPLVGAASIVAKVARDTAVDAIETEIGEPVGSGYPSDPTTQAFLEDWRSRTPDPPPHTRTAWSTMTRLGFGVTTLADFDPNGGTK